MSTELRMWIVYARGTDGVEQYGVRQWAVSAAGVRPVEDVQRYDDITELRTDMACRGLSWLDRSEGDEPHIMEVWL